MNGSVRTVDNLRQRFDGGEDVDLHQDADACAVASLLKQFLRDLPEGLIHPSIHNPLIQLYQGESASVFIHGRCGVVLKHLGWCSVSCFLHRLVCCRFFLFSLTVGVPISVSLWHVRDTIYPAQMVHLRCQKSRIKTDTYLYWECYVCKQIL